MGKNFGYSIGCFPKALSLELLISSKNLILEEENSLEWSLNQGVSNFEKSISPWTGTLSSVLLCLYRLDFEQVRILDS